MGGAYAHVSALAGKAPSPLFAPFLARLRDAVRDDIADCSAVAYASLRPAEACALLGLPDEAALWAYVARRALPWVAQGGVIAFGGGAAAAREGVDSAALMKNALHYANEIERIV